MRSSALAATAALALVGIGLAQYRDYQAAQTEAFSSPTGRAFLETYSALRDTYLKELEPEVLLKGALGGLVGATGDEFTYYLPPDASATRDEDLVGEFFGIGVGIFPANDDGTGVLVETIYRGSPAARAGLQAGDRIEKVDGTDVTRLPLNEAVRLIRGKKGTTVTLGVRRGTNQLTLKPVREKIDIVTVSTSVLPGNVGYLALSRFDNLKVTKLVQDALKDLRSRNVKGLVLDLRDNPGGLVTEAVGVADSFLAKGDVFITRGRSGAVKVEDRAGAQPTDWKGPLVVLVNSNSASAAEIVAAAIQENGRGKVVGEKTFGKGVAGVPVPLSNGGQVVVTSQEWLTPDRQSISKKGVVPDVKVEDTRFPKLLSIQGLNAPAGSEVTMNVGGRSLKLKADAEGKFSYQQEPVRARASDVQGSALYDLKTDAQLRKALELLGGPKTAGR